VTRYESLFSFFSTKDHEGSQRFYQGTARHRVSPKSDDSTVQSASKILIVAFGGDVQRTEGALTCTRAKRVLDARRVSLARLDLDVFRVQSKKLKNAIKPNDEKLD
jgi:hypothetical protein